MHFGCFVDIPVWCNRNGHILKIGALTLNKSRFFYCRTLSIMSHLYRHMWSSRSFHSPLWRLNPSLQETWSLETSRNQAGAFNHEGTRTLNLLIRSQTPCPLGHVVMNCLSFSFKFNLNDYIIVATYNWEIPLMVLGGVEIQCIFNKDCVSVLWDADINCRYINVILASMGIEPMTLALLAPRSNHLS